MNTVSSRNTQQSVTARCPQVRDAQWVCQKVKSFPHISSTKVTIPIANLADKHAGLYEKFVKFPFASLFKSPEDNKIARIFEWHQRLIQKMNRARDEWGVLRKGDYKTVGAILGQFKYNKLGNCGEDAFLSAAILKVNGVENAYIAKLTIDKLTQDHVACVFNKDGRPYSGKIEKDTMIIDPWLGVADFASKVFQKYKNLFSDYFIGLRPDSKISFGEIKRINLTGEETLLLSIKRPELLYPNSERCFMQKK